MRVDARWVSDRLICTGKRETDLEGCVIPPVGPVEYTKIAVRTALGFVVMGFIGFFVKLIFIPINNIIIGG